jgi:predicted Zn-dependent peptidase
VSVALFFDGGVTNYPAEKAGLEYLTLLALMQGPADEEWRKTLRDAHAEFQVFCTEDYSVVGFTCLRKEVDDVWPLFADCVRQPAFPPDAVEAARAQMLSLLYQEEITHNGLSQQLLRDEVLPGFYRDKTLVGKADYIKYLRPEDLREYYASLLLNRKRMTLAVSGNLDYEDVSEWVLDKWGIIPSQPYQPLLSPITLPLDTGLHLRHRDGLETRITGVLKAPPPGSREEAALLLGLDLAMSRTIEVLESQQSYPSLAQARLSHTRWPYVLIELQGREVPLLAGTLVAQLRRVYDDGVSAQELSTVRAHLATRQQLSLESSDARAFTLGRDAIVHHWEDQFRLRQHLHKATPAEVTTAVRRYLPVRSWAIVGDTLLLDRQIFLQPSGK